VGKTPDDWKMKMTTKTVLITGCSTGIGHATAEYFQQQGWNVAATMRTPAKAKKLARLKNVICPALDVTKAESIKAAVDKTIKTFGAIDVVVNNAGYGLTGPFEGADEAQIRRQFDTNVIGMMAVTRALLPHFRQQQQGCVVNIASVGGRVTFPLYSLYHSTKWAVEGFSESLRYELAPLNIQVKIIEPGAIKTDFYDRSNDSTDAAAPDDYQAYSKRVMGNLNALGQKGSPPSDVAATIFRAASDGSSRLRYPVGMDAKALLLLRRLTSDTVYSEIIKTAMIRG
jgi:NAD(P)-dependent dehydrogenase (short-subunit alcohol dehydrogenase family)